MAGASGSRLTAKTVAVAMHPGTPAQPVRLADGGGLYLQVSIGGAKSWLLRFKVHGRTRVMGLGPASGGRAVTLAAARIAAAEARAKLRLGNDPIESRTAELRSRQAEQAKAAAHTFRAVAETMMDAREQAWRNAKHRQQWRSTLATYAYPIIGDMPVRDVGTDDVLRVLQPVWSSKPETASRLRGRIERVLAYARTRKLREGDNPATWRGHLAETLPSPRRIVGKAPGHHAALPWQHVPAFMGALALLDGVSARALAFTILTAGRTGEVLGARWGELDLEAATWTVPADRMKAKREHRVPLSPAALDVVRAMEPMARGRDSFVFPSVQAGKPLSSMALLMMLRRMNAGTAPRWADGRTGGAITAHGFRSSFRDWCGEASRHGTDLAEAALAHVVRDKTEAAYARGDLFTKRAALMADWAVYCGTPALDTAAKVVPMRRQG